MKQIIREPDAEIQNLYHEMWVFEAPDPSWRFVDAHGHPHQWAGEEGRETLPSLRWIVEVPAGDEYPELGHHECLQCGEHVDPKMWTPPWPLHVYIGSVYRINGEEVSKEEFMRVQQERALGAFDASI